jgi:hypothetical protein
VYGKGRKLKSIEYRAYARDCLVMIERVASEAARASLVSMAQCWHRLARDAEEAERPEVVRAPEPPDSEATSPD